MRRHAFTFACICASSALITGIWAAQLRAWAAERREIRHHGCLLYPLSRHVLVAARTLPPGRAVFPEDVRVVEMPDQYLEQRGQGTVQADESKYVLAQAPTRVILQGDPLRWADFEP